LDPVKVAVLSTSYPRTPGDVAGGFVADAVEAVRKLGVEVAVVSPAGFGTFGVAYGDGIVQNLRARPWRVALLPAFMAAYTLAARRAARDADVVHAHWLPSAIPARATGAPYVLQLWGTDVELARRIPRLARALVRGAHAVVAASTSLAEAARSLGARRVEVIPAGVDLPDDVVAPESPPHVLYVGRLSPEKGVLDFVAGTDGLPRRIVGDGPLRARIPDAVGFESPAELARSYGRAAVVCVPSRREGYGMTAREAMAYGRALVATRVGGLADAFVDGESGIEIPPEDPAALRAAVERLLGDEDERRRIAAGARTAAAAFSRAAEAGSLVELWSEVAR
jgi:glycosyltransferase involved in cell wall biosynthesis